MEVWHRRSASRSQKVKFSRVGATIATYLLPLGLNSMRIGKITMLGAGVTVAVCNFARNP